MNNQGNERKMTESIGKKGHVNESEVDAGIVDKAEKRGFLGEVRPNKPRSLEMLLTAEDEKIFARAMGNLLDGHHTASVDLGNGRISESQYQARRKLLLDAYVEEIKNMSGTWPS